MNNQISKSMQFLAAALGLVLLSVQPVSVVANDRDESAFNGDHKHKITRIPAVTVTGVNSVRGKPFFNWGGPFGSYNFPTIFVYNQNGGEPLEIDENTPNSALLATGVSPGYLFIRGETPDVVKPEWVNVPLRKVPVNIDFDPSLTKKMPLRGLLEAEPMELSQAEPANDVTLGQWMKASGAMTIDCWGGGADLKFRMKNLLPVRIYSLWATMELPPPGSTIENPATTLPIGGTPSIFMTDKNGDATFERRIKFCPTDTTTTAVTPMLTIDVLYHANHSTYGAIPAPGIMLGLLTFPHLLFPINVQPLNN